MQSNNKKICIVASSLGKGGAERSSAQLSIMLHNLNYEVHIVTVLNKVDYEFKGTLFNLGFLKNKDDSIKGKFSRYLKLKKYLKSHGFIYVIDNRSRVNMLKELFFHKYLYKNLNVIYVVRSFNLDIYFPKPVWFSKVLYRNARQIVAVSKDIKVEIEKRFNFSHIKVIYNPLVNFGVQRVVSHQFSYILYYGRLDDSVKNISLLLQAYKASSLSKNNIRLVIMGEGEDEDKLKKKAEVLGIDAHVLFKTYESNPLLTVSQAYYVCLTSRYEGFPRVLLESLSLGVPVISVDCKSGPSEIISNGVNGILVENFNVKALSDAMNSFIFDATLYQTCKSNAKQSVERFSVKNITNDWKQLLDTL